jgi:bacteriocin biosynthesis cyclodehydratase domain-containing protein
MAMHRPALKAAYHPLPGWPGELRLGTEVGMAVAIEDPDGHIDHLISLMDGQRTIEAIGGAAGVCTEDVETLVTALAECGFLEDAALDPPAALSPVEVQRYARNLNFFSTYATAEISKYDFQVRLKQSRVLALGLGSVGSQVVLDLARMGVGWIDAVDHDQVETANLSNQVLYRDTDVGRDKTESAAARVAKLNPRVHFVGITRQLASEADVAELLNGHDLVIRAVDRPYISIHEWVNAACVRAQVPYIGAGLVERRGSVGPLVIPYETGCYGCQWAHSDEDSRRHMELLRTGRRPAGNVATNVTAGILGHFVALEAIKYLAELERPASLGRRLHFDFRTLSGEWDELPRHPACPICGNETR